MRSLVELSDGLLVTPDSTDMVKVRSLALLPEEILIHVQDKSKIETVITEEKIKRVTVIAGKKKAVFDYEYFEYVRHLVGQICYLSNVPLNGEMSALYPLVAEYQYGWCVLAPLGV